MNSKLTEVILVLGYFVEEINKIIAKISSPKLKSVFNPDFGLGMSTSIKVGIDAAKESAEGYMIILGDMPFLTTRAINLLLEEFSKVSCPAVAFWDQNRPVHPVVLNRSLKPRLLDLTGDKGARELLEELDNQGLIKKLNLPKDMAFLGVDIDTPIEFEYASTLLGIKRHRSVKEFNKKARA